MSDEKLLPCPFCGGEPELHWINEAGEVLTAWVSCKCGCEHHERLTREVAVKKWNSRCIPNDAQGSGMPDNLRSFVDSLRNWPACEGHDAFSSHYVGELFRDAADVIERLQEQTREWQASSEAYRIDAERASAPPDVAAGAWQPIETAPKDKTQIIVCGDYSDDVAIVRWDERKKDWLCVADNVAVIQSQGDMWTDYSYFSVPSHWQPCPIAWKASMVSSAHSNTEAR